MQPDYVILLLKCFLTQLLSGAYREGDSWSGFYLFNIISYCSPPHCILSQAFLSLKPQSSFLPIDIYICCFFYMECISPAFHMEGSSHLWYQFTCHHFREAFSDLYFVGYYSHSIPLSVYHITLLIFSKAHMYSYLVYFFPTLFNLLIY